MSWRCSSDLHPAECKKKYKTISGFIIKFPQLPISILIQHIEKNSLLMTFRSRQANVFIKYTHTILYEL